MSKRAISSEIPVRFPATLELGACALVVALAVGLPAGIIFATRHNCLLDNAAMASSLLGISMCMSGAD